MSSQRDFPNADEAKAKAQAKAKEAQAKAQEGKDALVRKLENDGV